MLKRAQADHLETSFLSSIPFPRKPGQTLRKKSLEKVLRVLMKQTDLGESPGISQISLHRNPPPPTCSPEHHFRVARGFLEPSLMSPKYWMQAR